MSYTATTIYGKRREERLEPWLDPAGDLARLCDAVGQMYQAILEVAEESGEDGSAGYVPPWGKLLDPVNCPAKDLPYLGQFVGVEVPKGATGAEAREAVKHEAGLERGTLASIEAAIERIIGAAPYTIQERTEANGSEGAYHFNVLVGTGKSSTALKEAIEAVKPGGVFFSILEVKNSWLQAVKIWSATGATAWSAAKEGNT